MTSPPDSDPPDRSWLSTYAHRTATPARPLKVALTVTADGHPDAPVVARLAGQIVTDLQHYGEFDDLNAGELGIALADVVVLLHTLRALEEDLIVRMRDAGASWAELGARLGVARATAKERYERIVAARTVPIPSSPDADGGETRTGTLPAESSE
ncbi:AsnC family protein [Cryptosporangium aurantiacum]|uniref:Uncharacterized protein n=1 Tax=Cryptosporangium aurantiacum TaxID=134849 RepID=A0A1M7RQ69_9ACTN|nr:AsnC family protein [Cryptosporangium aurantiacum]SHN48198.1 hypothetical protein SAMN05443668_13616 [Cryptosporangium aurantiacum]